MTSPDTDPRPLSCDEMVELVTAYLEGALGPDDTVSFEAHLGLCPGCRIYLDQFRETIRSASTLAESEVPPRRHGRSARVLPGVAGSPGRVLTRRTAYGRVRP